MDTVKGIGVQRVEEDSLLVSNKDDSSVVDALDRIVLNAFRPVLTGLAVLYLFFTISHLLVLPAEVARLMAVLALASSVVCVMLRMVLQYQWVPVRFSHLFGTGVAVVMLANCAGHLYLTGDPLQTTNFLIVAIGIACIFLSRTWFILAEALIVGSWVLVVSMLPDSSAWLHFAFAFVTTISLAAIIFLIRMRNFRRLEEFRLRDEKQKEELAIALGIAEESNAALERNNRQLAEARDAAEVANRAKSEFLANMSHEIRTPLNAVIGLADVVLEDELVQEQRESVEMIQTSGTHLLAILNNVLDFAKIEAGQLELECIPFSVQESVVGVREILSFEAREKGLDLQCEICDDLPEVLLGDPVRIRQVLLNLAGNAVKFTHKGEVAIEVKCLDQTPERAVLLFAEHDTGIGLPADKKEHIFESFSQADSTTTRQYGGTGLGLSISARLVEAMGGRIWVESEEGKGSVFQFELALDVGEEGAEEVATSVDQEISSLKVLLAEDNVVNQRVAMRMLEQEGHTVRVVGDGQQALLALKEESFDLLLTDIQMPEMDGLDLTRSVRANEAEGDTRQTIVALTAHASETDRQQCLAAGADDYLTKPLRKDDLVVLLHRVASKAL